MISSRILLAGLFCLCPLSLAQKIEPDPKHTLIIILHQRHSRQSG